VRVGASRGQSIVSTVLRYLQEARVKLLVVGSLELMKLNSDVLLGSVAHALARQAHAHCCIVKAYGQDA